MVSYNQIFEGVFGKLGEEAKYTVDWWGKHLSPVGRKLGQMTKEAKEYWGQKAREYVKSKGDEALKEELQKKTSKYGQTLLKLHQQNKQLHDKVEQLQHKAEELQTAKGAAKVLGKHAADLAKEHPVATGIAGGLAALGLAKKLLNRKKKENK